MAIFTDSHENYVHMYFIYCSTSESTNGINTICHKIVDAGATWPFVSCGSQNTQTNNPFITLYDTSTAVYCRCSDPKPPIRIPDTLAVT